MFTLDDINNIEGEEFIDDDEYYRSVQRAINDGLWAFQGSYGRTMMDAIKSGYCLLGKRSFTDYWGNHVPSRFQVVDGTVGSPSFVKTAMGMDWYKMMEEL
jgi:hypothetical protein